MHEEHQHAVVAGRLLRQARRQAVGYENNQNGCRPEQVEIPIAFIRGVGPRFTDRLQAVLDHTPPFRQVAKRRNKRTISAVVGNVSLKTHSKFARSD